ncbi:MAG: dienelactone hydrolase family protein [Eubacteriales bacterium]|nr:dienelactone hydrolase family protein [Eubacteriales bacterium]
MNGRNKHDEDEGMLQDYFEDPKVGNAYRETYLAGLDSLLHLLERESTEKRKILHEELLKNPEGFRIRIRNTLGWPLVEEKLSILESRREFIVSDRMADIYRVQIQTFPGVWMYGILFLRRSKKPLPCVICQHGRGGTPELCSSFYPCYNYNDFARRTLDKGVHVFCPQMLLWDAQKYGCKAYDRNNIDSLLKQKGSSIAAIEVDGLIKWLDYLQTLPEILGDSIGMIGLSFGGFYTLLFSALDTRINAAMTSCFFNGFRVHARFTDSSWFSSETQFGDAELAALVSPRKLWIHIGKNDQILDSNGALKEYRYLLDSFPERCRHIHFEVTDDSHAFPLNDDGIHFVVGALMQNETDAIE